MPVIILTANDTLDARIAGLNSGADDYLAKPFEMTELEARIRAHLRRAHAHPQSVVQCGALVFDSNRRQFTLGDEPLALTAREHAVLETLILRAGATVSKGVLTTTVSGSTTRQTRTRSRSTCTACARSSPEPTSRSSRCAVWATCSRPAMPARRSLRFQLLAGLLVPLGVVALVQFAVAYRNAEASAAAVTDRILLASARSIAEHIGFESSGLEVTVPPAALGMFDLGYGDTVYYRVTGTRGKLLAGYGDLPAAPGTVVAAQPAYVDAIYRGEPIRLVAVAQPIALARGVQQATVVVAQTLNGQRAMSRELWIGSALQQSLLIAIACGLAWLALQRVLRPLVHLGREVEDRSPNDLRPFSVAALQAELDPLMRALNAYMLRLGAQLDAQRRFTANAAHQMRTPLTLLRTQASYALRAGSEHERQEAIRAIVATTRQITRLTNQLLSLAKAEPQGHPPQRDPLDLVAVTHDILVEHGALAVERGIDLAFEVAPPAPPRSSTPIRRCCAT